MMKQITIEKDSFSDLIDDLNELTDGIDDAVLKSANAYGEAGVKALQQSYVSLVERGFVGDFIYSSIGFRMVKPNKGEALVWGGVGVYLIPEVMSRFGKTQKDFTAAQIAYWYEFGHTRYKSGARKPKSVSWNDVDEDDYVETKPVPFVSNAAVMGNEAMNAAFDKKLNELIR